MTCPFFFREMWFIVIDCSYMITMGCIQTLQYTYIVLSLLQSSQFCFLAIQFNEVIRIVADDAVVGGKAIDGKGQWRFIIQQAIVPEI